MIGGGHDRLIAHGSLCATPLKYGQLQMAIQQIVQATQTRRMPGQVIFMQWISTDAQALFRQIKTREIQICLSKQPSIQMPRIEIVIPIQECVFNTKNVNNTILHSLSVDAYEMFRDTERHKLDVKVGTLFWATATSSQAVSVQGSYGGPRC